MFWVFLFCFGAVVSNLIVRKSTKIPFAIALGKLDHNEIEYFQKKTFGSKIREQEEQTSEVKRKICVWKSLPHGESRIGSGPGRRCRAGN